MSISVENNRTEDVIKYSEQAARRAMIACGMAAEGYAKIKCPVDTGNLRNSISYKVQSDKREIVCHIGTNVKYAPYVEFGTGQYYSGGSGGRQSGWSFVKTLFGKNAGKTKGTKGQKPQPYLRPAVSDHIAEYNSILKDELRGG